MIKHNQEGAASGLAVSLVLSVVLLLASVGFGFWAYSGRQTYKDHADVKINAAVKTAVSQESAVKDKQFAEEAKNPLVTYDGPEALGSLVLKYPKTWSGYIDTSSGGTPLNGYFSPGVVPSISDQNSVFALRIQVVNQAYSDILQNYNNQQGSNLTVSAYALPKLPNVVGVEISGALSEQVDGTVVILPIRSQTLVIETDGTQYLDDFNNYILPNLSFSP